jgi:hypothetical protein
LKRDTREWTLLLKLDKGDASGFDAKEINHLDYQEAKEIMEQFGLLQAGNFQAEGFRSSFVERKVSWGSDGDTMDHYFYMSSGDKVWMFLPAQGNKLTFWNGFGNARNP